MGKYFVNNNCDNSLTNEVKIPKIDSEKEMMNKNDQLNANMTGFELTAALSSVVVITD